MLTRQSRLRLILVGLAAAIFFSMVSLSGCIYVNAEVDEPFEFTSTSTKNARANLQTQQYPATNFTGVNVGAHFDVSITPGEQFNVAIAAEPHTHKLLKAEVKRSVLHVGFTKSVRNPGKVVVDIVMPTLDYLSAGGAADVDVARGFNSNKIDVDGSGAASINIDINANTIIADLSGASDLDIKGRTNDLNLDGSGATDFAGRRLVVTNAKIDLSGSSSASVDVRNNLIVDLSGSSDVRCERQPQQLKVDTSGASDVAC